MKSLRLGNQGRTELLIWGYFPIKLTKMQISWKTSMCSKIKKQLHNTWRSMMSGSHSNWDSRCFTLRSREGSRRCLSLVISNVLGRKNIRYKCNNHLLTLVRVPNGYTISMDKMWLLLNFLVTSRLQAKNSRNFRKLSSITTSSSTASQVQKILRSKVKDNSHLKSRKSTKE